jgi:hypothetical protein
VSASTDSLTPLDNNEVKKPINALATRNGNIEKMSEHELRRAQHCVRMKLNNQNRSPSLAPPLGRNRQSLEDQLAAIDDAIAHKHLH